MVLVEQNQEQNWSRGSLRGLEAKLVTESESILCRSELCLERKKEGELLLS